MRQNERYSIGETIDGKIYQICRHPYRESFGQGAWYLISENDNKRHFFDEPLSTKEVDNFFVNNWNVT